MKLFLNFYFSFNLFFDYDQTETIYDHHRGDIVTFGNRLTAIGGFHDGRKVEVYNKPNWNDTIIPSVGNYDSDQFYSFSALSINKKLFVYGMNY